MRKKEKLRKIIKEEVEDQLEDIELEPSDETTEEWADDRYELKKLNELVNSTEKFLENVQRGSKKLREKVDDIEYAPFDDELNDVDNELEELEQKVEAFVMAVRQEVYEIKARPLGDESYRARSPQFGASGYY